MLTEREKATVTRYSEFFSAEFVAKMEECTGKDLASLRSVVLAPERQKNLAEELRQLGEKFGAIPPEMERAVRARYGDLDGTVGDPQVVTPHQISPARPSPRKPGKPNTLLWRMRTVEVQTGLSKTEIYRRIKLGTFPRPLKLGARAVAWQADAIEAWVKTLLQQAA